MSQTAIEVINVPALIVQIVDGKQSAAAFGPIRFAVGLVKADAGAFLLKLIQPQNAGQAGRQGVAKGEFDEIAFVGRFPDSRKQGLPRQPPV